MKPDLKGAIAMPAEQELNAEKHSITYHLEGGVLIPDYMEEGAFLKQLEASGSLRILDPDDLDEEWRQRRAAQMEAQASGAWTAEEPPEDPFMAGLGTWGRMRLKYLTEWKRRTFYRLRAADELDEHLMETDRQARKMMEGLTSRMAADEGVTEGLKARDHMEWARQMNNIQARAREVVRSEVVFI